LGLTSKDVTFYEPKIFIAPTPNITQEEEEISITEARDEGSPWPWYIPRATGL